MGTRQGSPPLSVRFSESVRKPGVIERSALAEAEKTLVAQPLKIIMRSDVRRTSRTDCCVLISGHVSVNLSDVKTYKNDGIAGSRAGVEQRLLNSDNVAIFANRAHFTGPHTIGIPGSNGW
ncbi:hypothetical protein [Burkholderia sp. SCN-KJ]|uniref:hypothetical protein n=1 Tax=Burkholderia sp. SCN-KJ TaxID=2969248 RepID=UPI00215054F4|nr:hypothetical protein [Burkholderia sp. SCN-KJ]MCR4470019.1 hypothetical protein [Burkholderia sp. SCN-KJ]